MSRISHWLAVSAALALVNHAACHSGDEGAKAGATGAGGAGVGGAGTGGEGEGGSSGAGTAGAAPIPFTAVPPAVYVAKVKDILVGLPPTDAEVKQVEADPKALATLIDGWSQTDPYRAKLLRFFQLAFQQTQIGAVDFTDMFAPNNIGVSQAMPLLVQNITESFARTALALADEGRPLNEAFTTERLMMTPPLMEVYAFLDFYGIDNDANVDDPLTKGAYAGAQIVIENTTIDPAKSADPSDPQFMHWGYADFAGLQQRLGNIKPAVDPVCWASPVTLPLNSLALHEFLFGSIHAHTPTGAKTQCPLFTGARDDGQFGVDDFNTWKMVTMRRPAQGEPTTTFFNVAKLRDANTTELVLKTPRPGFFSTPAFAANWPTNDSNQMRVTANQALIVATGMSVDGTDPTMPTSTPGLDVAHASPPDCVFCHRTLDPTRSALTSTYSWAYHAQTDAEYTAQKGLFAFRGVIKSVNGIDDFAAALASHPAFPAAWAQKLCYYANSSPCATDDPEFTRIVDDFTKSNFSFATLVRELFSSPLVTYASDTKTADTVGETVAVARRDMLCSALDERLGFDDVCGLNLTNKKTATGVVPVIAGGLPSDGYARGANAPLLPNDASMFYVSGLENICENIALLVIDPKKGATAPGKTWSSDQPDAAIAEFVSLVMALPPSDARSTPAIAVLKDHYTTALTGGAPKTEALQSTFTVACQAPSAIGVGM